MNPIFFAVFAATAFGVWTVFHKLGSQYVNQIFGAILVSFTAVIAGSIWLLPQIKEKQLYTNPKGILFLVLAGICAFFIDFFVLQAYSRGLPITVGGPIVIGGSIAVAAVIGFFLGDAVNVLKIVALVLIVVGASLLAAVSS